jgi:hypothetical protein
MRISFEKYYIDVGYGDYFDKPILWNVNIHYIKTEKDILKVLIPLKFKRKIKENNNSLSSSQRRYAFNKLSI